MNYNIMYQNFKVQISFCGLFSKKSNEEIK